MQQRRKYPPTLIQLIPPHRPRKIPHQRIQQQDLIRLRDLHVAEREVEVDRGDAQFQARDGGVDGEENAFVRLDADGHAVGEEGGGAGFGGLGRGGGEDVGVGAGFELDDDFGFGLLECWMRGGD